VSASDVGSIAYDMASDRVGVVMARSEGRVFLRPVGGGREWTTDPGQVRPATVSEQLSARVGEMNRNSRDVAYVPPEVPFLPCSRPCPICKQKGRQ
jgi:hypothetical protein